MLTNLLSDARAALRTMAAAPVFTFIVVLTLGLGVGSTTAMFAALETALLRPLPYPDPDRLVMGRATFSGRINPLASAYDYYDYREQSRAFESLAALTGMVFKATVVGEIPERVNAAIASHDLFSTLGVRPVAGRAFTEAEGVLGGPDVVMISHGYWRQRFNGSRAVVGSSVTINGQPQTIAGVLPAGFRLLFDVDVWFPMRRDGPSAGARRWHNWLIVGRLKPSVTLAQAQEQVDLISARLEAQYPDSNRGKALRLDPLGDAIVEGQRPRLWVMMAAVGLLLLIACGNVAALLLARGSARRTELAVRAALGASRGRLVAQLLNESFVLALAGGVAGVTLAWWLTALLPPVIGIDQLGIARLEFKTPVLVFAAGLSLVTGVLFGVAPVLQASSVQPARQLGTGRVTEARASARIRTVIVASQVAISLVLLVGSGLLLRSVARLLTIDPGFEVDHLLTAEISLPPTQYKEPEQRVRFFDGLAEEVRALPGVRAVGVVSMLPIRNQGNNIYVWREGAPPERRNETNIAYTRVALPGYFEAMGIPLLLGRSIERTDTADRPPVLVINETMARGLFPEQNPLGRRVSVDMGDPVVFEVVGVVGDARLNFIGGAPRQVMYHSYYQFPNTTMRLAIRTSTDPESLAQSLRGLVWRRDARLPVEDLASMDALIREQIGPFRTVATVISLFSAVALLLAAIGVYGVLAVWVAQRRHEIGVRMALGARPVNVARLVAVRGLWLVAAGLVLGLAAVLVVGRLLEQLLYGVEPTDPATYAAAVVVFVTVAAAACMPPAWRAARTDPIVELRGE